MIASIVSIPFVLLTILAPRRGRGRPNQWGLDPRVVKSWVYQIVQEYPYKLALRTIHYRLAATRGFPNVIGSFKWLSRWTKRWRQADPWLREKFVDFTRLPIIPKPPSISKIEVWMEKQSTYALLRDILERFKVPVQIQKGYGSVTMFYNAIRRTQKRGVGVIAYLGDIGPSGIDIQRITQKRMFPVKLKKIALTWGQVRKYKLPPRPAKPKDRRTPRYVAKYGNQTYELEALDPKILREITERKLRKLIPPEQLRELELREKTARVAVELLKPIRRRIERAVRELLERGLSPEQIERRLGKRIRFR